MIGAVVSDLGNGDLIVPLGEGAVVGIHIADKLGIVRIAPVFGGMLPRDFAFDLHTVKLLVEYDVFEVWVILENERDVVKVILQNRRAGFVLESRLPVHIGIVIREVSVCLLYTFLGNEQLDLFITHSKFAHFTKRFLFIVIAKQMDADDIKGIAKFEVCRVFGMVAVDEFIILDLHAGHAAGCDKMPAVFIVGRLINIRQKCLQREGYGIVHTVEQTDHALLCQRVLHLLLGGRVCLALTGRGRKSCRVGPFRVLAENNVRVEPAAVRFLIHKRAVCRRGRPVHELVGLIGTFVKKVDAQHLSQVAGYCHKFLRGHIPGQWEHQTNPGVFIGAAVGGVQSRCIRTNGLIVVQELPVDAVTVKCQHRAGFHSVHFSTTAFQHTADKATVVFGSITLRLAHLGVFLGGLCGSDGHTEPFLQIIKFHSLVDPIFCLSVITVGDAEITHLRSPPRSFL